MSNKHIKKIHILLLLTFLIINESYTRSIHIYEKQFYLKQLFENNEDNRLKKTLKRL